ncbi:NADH dehydrogenase subunit 5 (mitochondrion) [Varroa destructor]|uniref:NADH-ubiquinone oxidoreductase chain 5 n=1 Tax=Varroa destructor TaxID=109461 RepID=Q8HCK6_VARDE|nr:NADH dehydrogenase subunit 5 [Varroa destructor]CAD38000.1 NADH dehydrogenase subunit 5 [Varroa destructor]
MISYNSRISYIYLYMASIFLIFSFMFLTLNFICLKYNQYFIIEFPINNSLLFLDLNLFILIDWISSLFLFIVYFISSMIIFYSNVYMMKTEKKKFLILITWFIISMSMLISCPNLIIAILGWDFLGLSSYCLIIFYNNESSNAAGMITFMTNRLGDSGFIMGLIMMTNFYSWNMIDLMNEKNPLYFIIILLLLSALTKSAQLPFSYWLPAAMAAPTPVSALVHSSTLVTAGVYLLMRFNLFFSNNIMSELLMIISALTLFMASLNALFELDMKKIIAFSTLSQLSIMMLMIAMNKYELAFIHLSTHAIFKAMLFMSAGIIIHNSNNWQDIRHMYLLNNISPFITKMMMLANLSLMGFPFLSGFYSKDMILEMLYTTNNSFIIMIFIISSTFMTILYSLRFMYYLMKMEIMNSTNNFSENPFMTIPLIIMGLVVIFLGCFLSWTLIPNPQFIFMKFHIKIINLLILFISLYLYYIWTNTSIFISNKNMFFYNFCSKMWFMENTSWLFLPFLKSSKFLNKNTEFWLESSNSLFLNKNMSKFNLFLSLFQINSINNLMKISFVIIIIYFLY